MKQSPRVIILLALFSLLGAFAVACAEDSSSNGKTSNTSTKPSGGSLFGDKTKGGSGGTNGVSSKGGASATFSGSTKTSSSSTTTVERGTTDSTGCATACTKIIGCYGGFEETEQTDCVAGCMEAAVPSELACILAAESGTEEACMSMFDSCFGYDSPEDLAAIDYDDSAVADSALCATACTNLLSACGDLFGEVDQAAKDDCVSECADAAPYGEVLCAANAGPSDCEYMITACFGYEDDEFSEFEDEFTDPDTSGSTSGTTSGDTSGTTSGTTSGDTSGTATGLTDGECTTLCTKAVECGLFPSAAECQPFCDFASSDDVTCSTMHTCEELDAGACE
jgi:hypothetical protein